jgi:hypothetical protein
MTARHVFVDETKERGYVLVATSHVGSDVALIRKAMRQFVLEGQNRIHFAKESAPRRRAIIGAICETGVSATVYDTGRRYPNELEARAACLRAVIEDLADGHQTLLVLEQDDSLIRWDRQRLIESTRDLGCRSTLRYEHRRAKADLMLCVPDAVAWCWARGGWWKQRISDVVADVRRF